MTKKRKTAPAKVAEAAPTYTARSRTVATKRRNPTTRRPAAKKTSPGEALWQYFLTLPDEEQGAFLQKMLKTRDWREDIMDICVVMAQRNGPKDDYDEFEEELRREGRL